MNTVSFSTLGLSQALLDNLVSLDYHHMTPVQAQSLPQVLAGRDLIARAKTGSGKTAAFGLGLLVQLRVDTFQLQSLVLCPTRELADQVSRELRRLARGFHNVKILTLCGGTPIGPQLASLEHGAHIVVGTPGRVEEHLRKGSLSLQALTVFVLDEADRMLDMGFQPSLDEIITYLPGKRQNLLFSATYPEQIADIAGRLMRDPVMVEVDTSHDDSTIEQYVCMVTDEAARFQMLRTLLLEQRPDSSLVFCNTRREVAEVAEALADAGFSVLALHGDMEQRERDLTLVRFANKSASVLVATDVAARGLDIEAMDLVINYQPVRDTEVHTHRIGRTGRAGSRGKAFTLCSEQERFRLQALEKYLGRAFQAYAPSPSGVAGQKAWKPPMVTLQLDGGRRKKIRPGDILGALTAGDELTGADIGKIQIFDTWASVAVKRDVVGLAEQILRRGKLKGRAVRVRRV